MGSHTKLPPVSEVLAAIESELSEDNRALLRDNLRLRAFALGVVMALDQLYPESESKPLGVYLVKTQVKTMFAPDPLKKTLCGQTLLVFESVVHDVLREIAETHWLKQNSRNVAPPVAQPGDDATLSASAMRDLAKVSDRGQALHDVLGGRLQHVSDKVHESQAIIAEISTLVDTARSESRNTDMQHTTVRLLEVLRELVLQIDHERGSLDDSTPNSAQGSGSIAP